MAGELVDIGAQFKGLPISDLIGGPLLAACEAQAKMADSTAKFIRSIGFVYDEKTNKYTDATRVANFNFFRQGAANSDGTPSAPQEVKLSVPLLSIVKIPSLSITKVNVTFDMEVKSSFSAKETEDKSAKLEAEASGGFFGVKFKVNVQGSVASHKENTRSSDNSAKYHIEVIAEDSGMPEGLSKVLDIMNAAITAPATT